MNRERRKCRVIKEKEFEIKERKKKAKKKMNY